MHPAFCSFLADGCLFGFGGCSGPARDRLDDRQFYTAAGKLVDLHAAILLHLSRLRWANWVFFGLTIAIFSFLLVGRFGDKFFDMPIRLYFFWLAALISYFFLRAAGLPVKGWGALAASAILLAGIYRAAVLLPDISTSPFSLDWSEASRYFYASLFFSKRLYGIAIPPSVLHPTRYLLQSVPFLIPNSPLWVHRLWQVLLWALITFAASYLLARRLLSWRTGASGRWLPGLSATC